MDFDEKDEAIRFRLSTSMKRKLQLIAMRRGLNMSQFIRNYIETIISEDENQDILAARDARYLVNPKDEDENPYGSIVSTRVPTELKALYNACCSSNSLKASELIRNFMRDYTEFRLQMYPGHLRSLSGYLSYFLLFLRMAEYHKGRTFKSCRMVYAKNKIIPEDTPIIEKVTACTYRVNDILADCYYIIEFEDTTNVNVSFSPFD